jgi:hypothetical protein
VTPPDVWIWNWSWNCDPSSAPAVPTPPAGATIWIWNWQWDCPSGAPAPAAAVPSVCVQCNVAVSIRIASPGNDGDVTQSNLAATSAASSAASSASAASAAAAPQPVAQPALPPPPVPPSIPVVLPPMPVFTMPSIPPPPTVDVQRMLAGVVPLSGVVPTTSPAQSQVDDSTSQAAGTPQTGLPARQTSFVRRHRVVRNRTLVRLESLAFTRVVVAHSSRARSQPAKAPRPTRSSSQPLPSVPRAPFLPSSPAAAGTFGSSAHGGGASALTVSLTGALTFLVFVLLSSILPTTLPGRRRLSDDRHARPG